MIPRILEGIISLPKEMASTGRHLLRSGQMPQTAYHGTKVKEPIEALSPEYSTKTRLLSHGWGTYLSGQEGTAERFTTRGGKKEGTVYKTKIPNKAEFINFEKSWNDQAKNIKDKLDAMPKETLVALEESFNRVRKDESMRPFMHDEYFDPASSLKDLPMMEIYGLLKQPNVQQTISTISPASLSVTVANDLLPVTVPREVNSSKEASLFLKSLGLPGGYFLDYQQLITSGGDKSVKEMLNFVVYDDKLIDIVKSKKNYQGGGPVMAKMPRGITSIPRTANYGPLHVPNYQIGGSVPSFPQREPTFDVSSNLVGISEPPRAVPIPGNVYGEVFSPTVSQPYGPANFVDYVPPGVSPDQIAQLYPGEELSGPNQLGGTNVTDAMYPISGPGSMGTTGFEQTGAIADLMPADAHNVISSLVPGGSGGVLPEYGPVESTGFRPQTVHDILNTGQFIGTQDQANSVAQYIGNILNQRAAGVLPEGGTIDPETGEYTQDAPGTTEKELKQTALAAHGAQVAWDLAMDRAGIARDLASSYNVLYGGAPSAGEAAKSAYTEIYGDPAYDTTHPDYEEIQSGPGAALAWENYRRKIAGLDTDVAGNPLPLSMKHYSEARSALNNLGRQPTAEETRNWLYEHYPEKFPVDYVHDPNAPMFATTADERAAQRAEALSGATTEPSIEYNFPDFNTETQPVMVEEAPVGVSKGNRSKRTVMKPTVLSSDLLNQVADPLSMAQPQQEIPQLEVVPRKRRGIRSLQRQGGRFSR